MTPSQARATVSPAPPLRFGRFELQAAEQRLLADGVAVPLRPRALALLLVLAERAGRLVTRAELLDLVWPGLVVEENNLSVQINALRKVLGGAIVATVPGQGYRFEAVVQVDAGLPAPAPQASALAPTAARLWGRERALAALGALVGQHRLVTVVGAGGVGKTRLAQALLDEQRSAYLHGVHWVELAAVTDGGGLAGIVAAALKVQTGTGDALDGLAQAVAAMELLLVLDNAEHLLDAVAGLARRLHTAAPGLRLLVTCQAPLNLPEERVLRLDGLDVPAPFTRAAAALAHGAVGLFVARVQAMDARFALSEANVADVVELCRLLDGMALAIELAAARAALLGVAKVRALMGERLQLLAHSRQPGVPDRQRTLRATLEWSHGLLAPREQLVFRRLAVMAGSASLTLIQQVVADPAGELDAWAVLDAMSILADRSLLTVHPTQEADEPRYRLLESPAAYARELLQAAGEEAELRGRHARALFTLLEATTQANRDAQLSAREWLRRCEPDVYNARQAFAWAQAAAEPALALGLGSILMQVLPATLDAERLALCDACELLLRSHELPARLSLHAWGAVRRTLGMRWHQRARAAGRQELALARRLDDPQADRWDLFRALVDEALLATSEGDVQTGEQAFAEALAIEDPRWPPVRRIRICHAQMTRAAKSGDYAEALHQSRRCVALMRAAGANVLVGLDNQAKMELLSGDARAAVNTGQEVVTLLEASRNEHDLAHARMNLGAAWLVLDDTAAARQPLASGWPLALRFGLSSRASHLALLAALEQRPRSAVRIAAFTTAHCTARGQPLEPTEARALARASSLAEAALAPAEVARLQDEGALWRGEDLAALAFATQDS